MRRVSRREVLRLAGATGTGLLGIALGACAPGTAPASAPAPTAPTGAQPTAKAAPAQTTAAAAAWDQLVAAAQKEGKIVVSGPPVPEARTKMPEAFKQRFNIDMDYLAVNSSQLASRIETERAAGQYTMDVSMGGPDTVYATFLPNKWLDPLKPALILPEVLDPKVWPTGGPWFRDPAGETSLQLFNTITPIGYINTSSVAPDELKTVDDLLNPKWKGKVASYDPSVNGGGLIAGSVIYTVKGADFAKQLYQGQEIAYTRDYQQIADWVAHDSYPIGLAITPVYMNQYQGAVPVQELVLPDLPTATAGGYGIISLWNQAPHPNAAKVYVNWIASKDGLSVYGALDQSAPVRTDVDASAWVPPHLIPKPGGEYFDTFEYKYVMEKRQPIARFYASLKS
jgi:iron(III) transport system substrate-binding protein